MESDFSPFVIFIGILVGLVGLVLSIVWFWTLIKILTAKNDSSWKVLWGLVVFFGNIIGVIIYFIVAHKERMA